MSANELAIEIAILKRDIKGMSEDMRELKKVNAELLAFMHQIKGGKAWMLSMFALAGSIGGMITGVLAYIFK